MSKVKQANQELQQLSHDLLKTIDQKQREKVLNLIVQKEAETGILRRQEKKEKQQQQKEKTLNDIKEFSSGNIVWKLKQPAGFYPLWEGYYIDRHIFNLEQKFSKFELKFVDRDNFSLSFGDIQKKAETILERFLKSEEKKSMLNENIVRSIILPKKLQDKLKLIPENGMGYHIVDLILRDNIVVNKVTILNGSFMKKTAILNIVTDDIVDLILNK